jgi:hypothetical protein
MLNYNLIVKLAKKLDLPESIMSRIYVNNAVAAGVGWVPIFLATGIVLISDSCLL